MNAQQKRTARGLAVLAAGGVLLLVGALALELLAVRDGGGSTISEAFWRLWAEQPWVLFVVTHTLAAPGWWLVGHFTGQSRVVYDALRVGIDLDAALDLALAARAGLRDQTRQGNGREPLTVMLAPELVKALGPKES